MHELSIASSIVEIAGEHARREGGGRVASVTLRIGRLSSVHEDALRYSFDLVTEGTPLAGATLAVIEVPVRIWCALCEAEVELPGIQRFACPTCGHLSGDVRAGRELDIESIQIVDEPLAPEQVATDTPEATQPEPS
jgi:hydrogenase nickel incorporation protein HypA/HybF